MFRLKHHHMGLKRWHRLREEIGHRFEAALNNIQTLDPVALGDKREAVDQGRAAPYSRHFMKLMRSSHRKEFSARPKNSDCILIPHSQGSKGRRNTYKKRSISPNRST